MDKGLSATALTLLQGFVVIFLLLHDWVPLGRLNNLAAIRTEDSLLRRVVVTLLSALPPIVGLIWSTYFGQVHPGWLWWYLLITYGGFLAGLLRAWWIPYLVVPNPARAARYQVMFAGSHSLLPQRNEIAPDTLHIMFHLTVVATLLVLILS
jgi:hypothetical protein